LIQFLILVGLALFAILAAQRYFRTASGEAARKLRRTLLWSGAALVLLLAATGRLGLLIPLLGAVIATLLRLLPVLIPLLLQSLPLWQRWRRQSPAAGPQAAHGASISAVETRFLRMQLDHVSGEIAGEILAGRYAGHRLEQLDRTQLADLYSECVRNDEESATLLRAYFERIYGEIPKATRDSPSGSAMTTHEAYEVLGVTPGAARAEIIAAHRRLMQRLHPDRGGSDYLAAKINQAKDVLLNH
jgi:hypothetical protein